MPTIPALRTTEIAHPTYELATTRTLPWAPWTLRRSVTTARSAVRSAHLDFDVQLLPAGFHWTNLDSPHTIGWRPVERRRAVVRTDTLECLGFVADDYQLNRYTDAFRWIDDHASEYVAAGPIGNARQAFVVAKLYDAEYLNVGDVLRPSRASEAERANQLLDIFVVVRCSYDRTKTMEVNVVPVRRHGLTALPVSLDLGNGAPSHWSLRYNNAQRDQLTNQTRAYLNELGGTLRRLFNVPLSGLSGVDDARNLLAEALPAQPRLSRVIEAVIAAWQASPTNANRSNGYGLVTALAEYLQFGRSDGLRTNESRFTNVLHGGSTHKRVTALAKCTLNRWY